MSRVGKVSCSRVAPYQVVTYRPKFPERLCKTSKDDLSATFRFGRCFMFESLMICVSGRTRRSWECPTITKASTVRLQAVRVCRYWSRYRSEADNRQLETCRIPPTEISPVSWDEARHVVFLGVSSRFLSRIPPRWRHDSRTRHGGTGTSALLCPSERGLRASPWGCRRVASARFVNGPDARHSPGCARPKCLGGATAAAGLRHDIESQRSISFLFSLADITPP